jgi:hypothetical protein
MNIVAVGEDGKIRADDLRKALQVIAHRYARSDLACAALTRAAQTRGRLDLGHHRQARWCVPCGHVQSRDLIPRTVDHDGEIPLMDIVELAEGEGLGIVLEEAESDSPRDDILEKGHAIRKDGLSPSKKADEQVKKESSSSSSSKPRKEDIVADE